MLRMSKLTDYGTMVLAQLAASNPGWTTAGQVADATHLGQPTVSKLLKALVHAGLVVSSRGVQGGYALARPAAAISAAEILDALEGPVAITECSSSHGVCDLESYCRVGTRVATHQPQHPQSARRRQPRRSAESARAFAQFTHRSPRSGGGTLKDS